MSKDNDIIKTKSHLVPLSSIVLTLLSSSMVSGCSHFDMRQGVTDEKSAQSQTEKTSEINTNMSGDDADNPNTDPLTTYAKDDPRFLLSDAAKIAENDGDYAQAAGLWRKLIESNPDYQPALYGFSRTGRKAGLNKPVLSVLYSALAKRPNDTDLIAETAKVHYAMGEYKNALTQIDLALAQEGGKWEYYSLRGVIADKMNLFDDSKIAYEKALELSPDNPKVLNNYAISRLMSRDIKNAQRYAFDGANMEKSTIQNYQTYAKVLSVQGRYDDAKKFLEEKLSDSQASAMMQNLRNETSSPVLWGRNR